MSFPLYRIIPAKLPGSVLVTLGSSVTLSAGNAYDVPFEHARQHGAKVVVVGLSGPSTARPGNATSGNIFVDTTLSKVVVADGQGNWYDPFTGGTV